MDPNTFPTKGNLILAKNSLKLSRQGWELLGLLPREELDRIDTKVLDQYYRETVR